MFILLAEEATIRDRPFFKIGVYYVIKSYFHLHKLEPCCCHEKVCDKLLPRYM